MIDFKPEIKADENVLAVFVLPQFNLGWNLETRKHKGTKNKLRMKPFLDFN